jgi:hypothetical protein
MKSPRVWRYWFVWIWVAGSALTFRGAEPGILANSPMVEHLEHLKGSFPQGFTVIAQPPFVVIGDEAPAMVQQRATKTVKWAVDKLKQDYFKQDPVETP